MEYFTGTDLISYSTNLGTCIICIVLGIVLLCFNTEQKEDRRSYVNVKRFLAFAAFIAAVSSMLVMWMLLKGMDFRFLLTFIIPCICYWQLHTSTVALLSLIHSPKAMKAKRFHWTLPILLISAVHFVGFFIYDGEGEWLWGRYAYYCCTPFTNTLTIFLFVTIGIEFIFYATLLLKEVHRFNSKIDNYFTGRAEGRMKVLATIVRCFLVYYIFASADFAVSSLLDSDLSFFLNAAFMWVNTGAFVVAVIVVINMQNIYFTSVPAFALDNEESTSDAESADEPTTTVEFASVSEPLSPIKGEMEQIVHVWMEASTKPYLTESITLADAATEMDINPRLLSGFLNSVYGMNFNTWINSLRVEEVKRLLVAEPSISMTDVANRTGFTDASALSRTFKRLTGVTPTSYRNKTK